MPNPYFQFKQFTIYHDRCAMKVGTDGVLLGAWADVLGRRKALDVGSGSGLISLMLAQRNSSLKIDALEIDKEAALQASENILESPFSSQITVQNFDFHEFLITQNDKYDLIVSNPPFFTDSLKSPSSQRTTARHNDSLQPDDLIRGCAELLSPEGIVSVIYPFEFLQQIIEIGNTVGLFPARICQVIPKPNALPKRVLIELSRKPTTCIESTLVIEIERHSYSDEFKELTKDFYLER